MIAVQARVLAHLVPALLLHSLQYRYSALELLPVGLTRSERILVHLANLHQWNKKAVDSQLSRNLFGMGRHTFLAIGLGTTIKHILVSCVRKLVRRIADYSSKSPASTPATLCEKRVCT